MEFLTGFGLACLSLIFVLIARDFGRLTVAKVFLALLFAAGGFLLHPLVPSQYHWFTIDLQVMVPGLFWLLCQFAFTDRPKLKSVWAVMALYTALAPITARAFWDRDVVEGGIQFFGWTFGEWLEYPVILNGLWVIVSNWSNDLVESRRRLRVAMLVIVGFAVGSAVVSLNFRLAGEYTRAIIVSVSTFTVALLMLKGRTGALYGEAPEPKPPAELILQAEEELEPAFEGEKETVSDAVPDENTLQKEDEKKLHTVMAKGFYRTENLTLRMLAKEIGLPEYKTRTLINQTMGYRNFNDYINQLRISEAAQRLIEDPEVPILNISLDVGYRSISSFNRAFKDIMSLSPTSYRQETIQKN
ncbi:helix-turn-helix transcriptional regulator [Litoribacillus peritrichatus]|uniref:Helix-turn-helix domain-containing protein n=1 Tax=Litoribacillus peritrichatus TaxID=718191 RepID=A0ABP7M3S4_9GAMM